MRNQILSVLLRYKYVFMSVIVVGIIVYACRPNIKNLEDNANTYQVMSKNDLPDNVAVYVSYEAETLTVSKIEDDNNTFKESEGWNTISQIPYVDKIRSELFLYKDSSFSLTVNKLNPVQKIERSKSLSPQSPNAKDDIPVKFVYTNTSTLAYNSSGEIILNLTIPLFNYNWLLSRLNESCYKNNPSALIGLASGLYVDANLYKQPCYIAQLKKEHAKIEMADGRIMIIKKPLLNEDLGNALYGKIEQPRHLGMPSKMERQLNNDNKTTGVQNIKRDDNTVRSLEGKDISNFDQIDIIDTVQNKVLGKMIYEGDQKIVMKVQYKYATDDPYRIDMQEQEIYEIDPISNTAKTNIIQAQYSNVRVINNIN